MTGQSQEASLKSLMMTHQLRRKAAEKTFFQKKIPPRYIPQNDQRIMGIILSHICCGTSGPPPNLPVSLLGVTVSPSGVPVTGAQKGRGGCGKGARTTPCVTFRLVVVSLRPPARKPIFPQPLAS